MVFDNLAIVISSFALIISIGVFVFNWMLDQRKLIVKLKSEELTHFDDKNPSPEFITIFAYNNGQRPVTITNYCFKFKGKFNQIKYDSKNEKNNLKLKNNIKANFELIHILKQGETCYFKIKTATLCQYLNRESSGNLKLSGFYEGADGEIYESEQFILDMNNQIKICKSWKKALKIIIYIFNQF